MARTREDEEIRASVLHLENTVATALGIMQDLQKRCRHAEVNMMPRSCEGYGEPTTYWNDCHCTICGKRWTEPQ